MVDELRGLCATTYHGEDVGQYTPHLTLVQQIPAEQTRAALSAIERFETAYTFPVADAALVGRRAGAAWETLATIPIGPAARR